MSTVSIVRGEETPKIVSKALDLIGGLDSHFSPQDRVLIKPNVCGGVPGKIGTFTSLSIISAITSLLKGRVARVVIGEADSSMYSADRMLKENGITESADRLGTDVVNLSQGEMVKVAVHDGYVLESIKVNKIVTEATKIVSVPVAKTHVTTELTLNIKNMFGILPERKKGRFHSKIDAMLTDIVKTFPPALCIIDATTGLEGTGPFHGDPVKLDLVVSGDNAVATDAVMANIMGYDPRRIMHLRLASDAGLGPTNLDEIEIVGESLEEVRRDFKKAPREPFTRYTARIPGLGHLFVHYAYESAVKSWQRKAKTRISG
jgi:uncharacterized protein (DUF362 family)